MFGLRREDIGLHSILFVVLSLLGLDSIMSFFQGEPWPFLALGIAEILIGLFNLDVHYGLYHCRTFLWKIWIKFNKDNFNRIFYWACWEILGNDVVAKPTFEEPKFPIYVKAHGLLVVLAMVKALDKEIKEKIYEHKEIKIKICGNEIKKEVTSSN